VSSQVEEGWECDQTWEQPKFEAEALVGLPPRCNFFKKFFCNLKLKNDRKKLIPTSLRKDVSHILFRKITFFK